jgi:sugar phosphate permease
MQAQELSRPRQSRLIKVSPIFYGWVVLIIGIIGQIMTSPGQTYAVSIYIEHFITDLGISRSLVSTLYTAGTLVASLALPLVGQQLDRIGSRRMFGIITFLFGVACVYMGFVQNAFMLFIGFVLLRMLGQGSLSLVSRNVINQWWVRRRGMAMGIGGMVSTLLGSGSFPNLIIWLIALYGWRNSYQLLGITLWVVMLPLGIIFLRNRPEEYGLSPDGDHATADGDPRNRIQVTEENWTRAEAIRTSAFWLTSAGLAAISMLGTGLMFHIVSIFDDSGLSAEVAAAVFLPIAGTAAVMQLGSGILVDRFPVRILLSVALLFQAVVLVMAPYLYTVPLAILFGVFLGICTGLQATISNVIWAKYFGRMHLGSISGMASTLLVASSALGPMPMGIARDLLGNYVAVLVGLALLPLILSVATLIYNKPPRRR